MIPSVRQNNNLVPHRGLWARARGYYQRHAAELVFRRPLRLSSQHSFVSFTFDDFPRSALLTGGAILNHFGLAGTYFASFGLVGQEAPSGQIFVPGDLRLLFNGGHELGCHTFAHCHSWHTTPAVFERSIVENTAALARLYPGIAFQSFAYPISAPRPMTKARVAKHFLCGRGGGQVANKGATDLNQLAAFFLEKSRHDISAVKRLIDANRASGGWLVFATHDIADHPTPYGCTPEFFREVVRYAVESGADVLPIAGVLRRLCVLGNDRTAYRMPSVCNRFSTEMLPPAVHTVYA